MTERGGLRKARKNETVSPTSRRRRMFAVRGVSAIFMVTNSNRDRLKKLDKKIFSDSANSLHVPFNNYIICSSIVIFKSFIPTQNIFSFFLYTRVER